MLRPAARRLLAHWTTLFVLNGAALLPAAVPAEAGDQNASDETATGTALLHETAAAYEGTALLAPAARVAALKEMEPSLNALLKADLSDDERAAARFLSGEIMSGTGDYKSAVDEYRRAAKDADRRPFADDAAFRAVETIEASGRDLDAMRAWKDWEKQYPQSPLRGEASLAQAWNALRRGDNAGAQRTLAALASSQIWYE